MRLGVAIAAIAALLSAAVLSSWWALPGTGIVAASLLPRDIPSREVQPGGSPPASEYWLEPGYRLEMVAGGLTYPTAVAFGPRGEVWVSEAGYSPGGATAVPRIVRVLRGGAIQEVCRLPDGPVTGLRYHEGFLYAIGGRGPAEIWQLDLASGNLRTVITGLPVWGRGYTSDLAFGQDGRMYFAVGSPSNSGVISPEDLHTHGYLAIFPEARDIPAVELKLQGQVFESEDPFATAGSGTTARTGAFHPFGQSGPPGEVVPAGTAPQVTGAVLRAHPDGTGLEVVGSGFRHIRGLGFAPDGRLLAINLGMDDSGSRPVANDPDAVWLVQFGGWYGFPDYASGVPVTEERFRPAGEGPAPEPLLAEHPPLAEGPYVRLAPGGGAHGFTFARDERFGFSGQMFVAQFGSLGGGDNPAGHRIIRLDLETREAKDFYINLAPGPSGSAPERPTAVRFGPDGCLYVVDFGRLAAADGALFASAMTGALWRITPRRVLMTEPGGDPGGAGQLITVGILVTAALLLGVGLLRGAQAGRAAAEVFERAPARGKERERFRQGGKGRLTGRLR